MLLYHRRDVVLTSGEDFLPQARSTLMQQPFHRNCGDLNSVLCGMDPEDQHIGQVSSRIGFFIIWLHASDGQSKDVKQCPPSGVSVIEYLALHSIICQMTNMQMLHADCNSHGCSMAQGIHSRMAFMHDTGEWQDLQFKLTAQIVELAKAPPEP